MTGDDSSPLWLGSASFDRGVGLSHETDAITVMTPVGAVADRLFKGQILRVAFEQQPADRRVGIGVAEQHAFADLDRGLQRDGVGGVPSGRGEAVDKFPFGADKADMIGSPGMPCGVCVSISNRWVRKPRSRNDQNSGAAK